MAKSLAKFIQNPLPIYLNAKEKEIVSRNQVFILAQTWLMMMHSAGSFHGIVRLASYYSGSCSKHSNLT